MSDLGHSLPGRASSKSGHVSFAPIRNDAKGQKQSLAGTEWMKNCALPLSDPAA
jgi:hypothetical protein